MKPDLNTWHELTRIGNRLNLFFLHLSEEKNTVRTHLHIKMASWGAFLQCWQAKNLWDNTAFVFLRAHKEALQCERVHSVFTLFLVHVGCHTLISPQLLSSPPPPASRLGLLHYRARLTRADTHTLPQSSPGIGFLNTVQQELVLHLFFFTSLLLFILFLLPFLSFCVLTQLIFPALVTPHPPLWGHPAMTNGGPRGKEGVGFLLFSVLPSRVLCVCVGGKRNKRKHPNINRRERPSQVGKLVGGGHRQITCTQKHSSSLPHTCWSVLFGLDPVR